MAIGRRNLMQNQCSNDKEEESKLKALDKMFLQTPFAKHLFNVDKDAVLKWGKLGGLKVIPLINDKVLVPSRDENGNLHEVIQNGFLDAERNLCFGQVKDNYLDGIGRKVTPHGIFEG